ncbi:tyrosinase family protein [Ensifer sp. NBAIM29]|nr:tyrosinase family protein [Ensifer sp. NBAIM29]
MIIAKPTWDADVKKLFVAPFWIAPDRRADVARQWIGCMRGYLIDLDDVASVREWSVTIYNHLASRNMPLTTDTSQFWPIDALETFRLWVNQGWRVNEGSPFDPANRIPPPDLPQQVKRVRPDIRSLSAGEIDVYRAKLDDVMQIGDPDSGSPWQRYAYVHTNWCLHYQEAFALWHRAYLLYLEELIDHAIPFWDWMAEDASVDGSPEAGIPQPFLDETYVHPVTGEKRPNPLRYAAAKDGKSKLCAIGKMRGPDCRFVQRNPLFYTSGETDREERTKLYAMSRIFQQQVVDALKFGTFSTPQGFPGYPWANIQEFDPPQPDDLYPYREVNFDGLFEQPHDNYHGWLGPDMGDNAYTAFDPLFSSYHANIDRMLEVWIRNHPDAQFTTQTPLQPFLGPGAREVSFSTADHWRYTSLGQMAQDSRRIGYDYGEPVARQFQGDTSLPQARRTSASASILERGPWVVFDGVRCTHDSYVIDVFINLPEPTQQDAAWGNKHYVGRFSRIGMGIADDKGRCITRGVSRVLNAGPSIRALELQQSDEPQVSFIVSQLDSGRVLTAEEYQALPGFIPKLIWGDPRQTVVSRTRNSGGCCMH